MPADPAPTAIDRPSVDVVVPLGGELEALEQVIERMSVLRLRAGDSLVVVDNRVRDARPSRAPGDGVRVIRATGRATPGFARNRGAALGRAKWIVFLDADAVPEADLLDRYFEPPPTARTALLAGGVHDEPVPANGAFAARYAYLRGAMSQQDTFNFGEWGYPKSANVACRRAAFEAVGGFNEDIRAAEDADLTYKLRARGWEIERREAACAVHLSRSTVWGLIKQKAMWGAGGAWLNRRYPGSVPLAAGAGGVRWAVQATAREFVLALRRRDRDAVIYALLRPVEALAWEAGRLLSNERKPRGHPHSRKTTR